MSRRRFVEGILAAARALGQAVRRLPGRAWHVLDFLLLVAGVACIVRGVAVWSVPAAWILAGVAVITFQYLSNRRP